MHYDVAVVGAGPAGLLTSIFIKSKEVVIFEDHREVGVPKHCTGLVGEYTAKILSSLTTHGVIDAVYSAIIFHTPRGDVEIESGEPIAYHVDRPLLEQKLLDRASSLGHRIVTGVRARPRPGSPVSTGIGDYHPDIIVAADGPLSVYRRYYHGGGRTGILVGVQRIYRVSGIDPGGFHVFYDKSTPWFFQWLVPLDNDHAIIGFAERPGHLPSFEKITSRITARIGASLGGLVETYGGVIPLEKPMKNPIVNNRVFFIGDSLPATKPYTGGGLYGIARLAPLLGRGIDTGDLSRFLGEYRIFRRRLIYEHLATSIAKMIGYWRPALITSRLFNVGALNKSSYDNHLEVIIKALSRPHILIQSIF